MPTYVTKHKGIDYGPRDGTLGLSFHMTEGSGGVGDVTYLTRHPGEDLWEWADRINGVSAHIVLTEDGTLYQMVPFDHACGNLNPEDRAGEYGYYGHQSLVDVLGTHWPNPNAWNVSMEIAGKRAKGPTTAQVQAAIDWGLDMRDRFPTIRGANGHHDNSPKPCPGKTPNMLAIFEGVGGHGLFKEDSVALKITLDGDPGSIAIIPDPRNRYYRVADGTFHEYTFTSKSPATPVTTPPEPKTKITEWYLVGDELALIPRVNATFTPAPVVDCKPLVDKAIADTKASGHIVYS